MTKQRKIFSLFEGDNWFNRNKNKQFIATDDEIIKYFHSINKKINDVLEIGCSDGNRLNAINKIFGHNCYGIDPSKKAIKEGSGKYTNINLEMGTADSLKFNDNSFEIIIFGFCLYLCDRDELFKIAFEADRCLKDGGIIIIKDFAPPFAYRNKYNHSNGIYSYKMDYSNMFKWNPYYTEIEKHVLHHNQELVNCETIDPEERVSLSILQKSTPQSYPVEPFKGSD